MKRWSCALALGLMMAALPGVSQGALGVGTLGVTIEPFALHPGGTVYVSGQGFHPLTRPVLQISCPGLALTGRHPDRVVSRPILTVLGPRTNARGTFAGYPVRTPRVSGVTHCTVFGRAGDSAVLAGATYRTMPATASLPACAVRMCIHARAFLIRLGSGTQGTVVVSGWPGARVRVNVYGPGIAPKERWTRLDYKGAGAVKMRVAFGLKKSKKAIVTVATRFGAVTGQAVTRFAVIPGGR